MLEITDLAASYSGIKALRGISLAVPEGRMVALIGPNGAGKSTLLNCISGIVKPAGGSIRFAGEEIGGATPWSVAHRGLLQVPEGRQVLAEMTVLENLQLGATALGGRPATYPLERVCELFPILAERRAQLAGSLSGGQQQMLAIGRALMGAPRVLLLDEPSLGLAPLIVRQVFATLTTLNRDGLTILLVEQNARQALAVSHHAYVLEQGHIAHSGPSEALARDPAVIAHYLGQAQAARG
ncbi:MAG: ABC transporter ATP-binding protein [Alphaproteobacteria bacterium]|nr:ABC transporter ATP-binding protein [Alphaproteobacteria bacterium]